MIIIKKEDKELILYSFSPQPHFIEGVFQDLKLYMRRGRLNKLKGLEINKEYYDLDFYKDFVEVKRIKQQKQKGGLIYDTIFYELKPFTYCQSEIEGNKACLKQCDHCKEYYKPLEENL